MLKTGNKSPLISLRHYRQSSGLTDKGPVKKASYPDYSHSDSVAGAHFLEKKILV